MVGMCFASCTGNDASTTNPIIPTAQTALMTNPLSLTPGCLHFTDLGSSAIHGFYATSPTATTLKAVSSNPLQAAVSPQTVSVKANVPFQFSVTPKAYGRSFVTLTDSLGHTARMNVSANEAQLYVANSGSNDILVFNATQHGNVAPVRVIGGTGTFLADNTRVAADCNGNLYATNDYTGTVNRYPISATGSVVPTAQITGFRAPSDVAFDSVGHIFVNDAGAIDVFSASANGHATPLYTLAPVYVSAGYGDSGLAIDDEDHLYAIYYSTDSSNDGMIVIYSSTTSGKPPSVRRVIIGPNTHLINSASVAVSRHHYIWAVDDGGPNGLYIFSPTATGDAAPSGTIAGPNTQLFPSYQASFDSNENVYVTNVGLPATNSIVKFDASQSGNATPAAVIKGSITQLNVSAGLLVY